MIIRNLQKELYDSSDMLNYYWQKVYINNNHKLEKINKHILYLNTIFKELNIEEINN